MSDQLNPEATPSTNITNDPVTGQFVKGHRALPRSVAGKQRATQLWDYAKKISKEHNLPFNGPLEALLYMGLTGIDPKERDPKLALKGIPLVHRIDCLRLVSRFMQATLRSMEVTGADGEPLFERDSAMVKKMATDPKVRELMETVARTAIEVKGEKED